MKEKKVFRILSIDGGGIKGLYSASILEKFEKTFNCLTSDHFDMIAGTSTGGLIALAISLKIPANKICDFYTENGQLIFPKSKKVKIPFLGTIDYSYFKQIAKGGKYSDSGLKKALKKYF